MPSINMIAARRAEKKRLEKLVSSVFLVIIGEIVITLAVVGFMTARVHAANVAIRGLDAKLTELQPTVDKISRYEKEIKALEPRLNLLAESRERTLLWYTVLEDLSRSMPEKTWLTSVSTNRTQSQTGEEAALAISLAGVSMSQRLVGETMLCLNQFPEFKRVDLDYTQEGNGEWKTLEFQVVARLASKDMKEGGTPHASN
ncbi:MAG TPA: PilN domain-containing protein [Armatimonadota bacterium]|nr:PilN domain-containing protein [Armatimonadota bacterium]